MRRVALCVFMLTGLLLVPALAAQEAQTPAEICAAAVPASDPDNRTFSQAGQVTEPGVDYRAVLCTGVGPIYVDLLEEYTPITVDNFVFLAEQGFYNNTTFHRVIADFMAQGGDPEGTGRGGPGYSFEDEFAGFLNFDKAGWLAMANAGPGTNGSQFFITTAPATHLNFLHTIFGEVLEGQDVVESIEVRDPETATEPGTALNTVVIITDPATVNTTFVDAPPATEQEVADAFTEIEALLPPEVLAVDENASGTFTNEQLIELAPEDQKALVSEYLSSHNHEYKVASTINNTACDLENIAFASVSYSLDAYPSGDEAAAALADPALAELTTANGFTSSVGDSGLTVYTQTGTVCDTDVIIGRAYWQRGHFVATAQIAIPADVDVPMDQVLTSFVGQQIFEQILSNVLRPEVRAS